MQLKISDKCQREGILIFQSLGQQTNLKHHLGNDVLLKVCLIYLPSKKS